MTFFKKLVGNADENDANCPYYLFWMLLLATMLLGILLVIIEPVLSFFYVVDYRNVIFELTSARQLIAQALGYQEWSKHMVDIQAGLYGGIFLVSFIVYIGLWLKKKHT